MEVYEAIIPTCVAEKNHCTPLELSRKIVEGIQLQRPNWHRGLQEYHKDSKFEADWVSNTLSILRFTLPEGILVQLGDYPEIKFRKVDNDQQEQAIGDFSGETPHYFFSSRWFERLQATAERLLAHTPERPGGGRPARGGEGTFIQDELEG